MTPDEKERIAKEKEEELEGWFGDLPEDEARVWLEAHIEDLEKGITDFEEQAADWQSLLNLATLHGTNPLDAIKAVQIRPTRTQFEMETLAAWGRLRKKHNSK